MVIILKQYERGTDFRKEGWREFEKVLYAHQLLHPALEVCWDAEAYAITGRPNRRAKEVRDDAALREALKQENPAALDIPEWEPAAAKAAKAAIYSESG